MGNGGSGPELDMFEDDPGGQMSEGPVHKVLGIYDQGMTLLTDLSTKVDLSFKLAGLERKGSYFIVTYTRAGHHQKTWEHIGTTEFNCEEARDVTFQTNVRTRFMMETPRFLHFECYKVRDAEFKEDLTKQKFIGTCSCRLVEILLALSKGSGWQILDVIHPIKGEVPQGMLGIYAAEDDKSKQEISFECSAMQLTSTDPWKRRADPYLVMTRTNAQLENGRGDCTGIYRTCVARKTSKPSWERIALSAEHLWPRADEEHVLIQVRDWFRQSKHRLVGETWLRYTEIDSAFRKGMELRLQLYRPKKGEHIPNGSCMKANKKDANVGAEKVSGLSLAGELCFKNIGVERRFTFLDYIRGGLEIRLIVAIDFSRSNVDQRLHTTSPNMPNAYINVIKAMGTIMQVFDSDSKYPVYGLAAKLPPSWTTVSDAFALNGDFFDPEVDGIEGICSAYRRALKIVGPHGPTRFSTITELAVNLARPYAKCDDPATPMVFSVMLILTDGGITTDDEYAFAEQLANAASLPLTIVIAGIGGSDFSFMQNLQKTVRAARRTRAHTKEEIESRDVLHFADIGMDFKNPTLLDEVASRALSRIPREIMGYYRGAKIEPRGIEKYEDKNGKAKQTEDLFEKKVKPVQRTGTTTSAGSKQTSGRSGTNRSLSRTVSHNGSEHSHQSGLEGEEEREVGNTSPSGIRGKQPLSNAELPIYLANVRDRLRKDSIAMGYQKCMVERALREGCPTGSMETFLDCIANCGFGKAPNYKSIINSDVYAHVEARDQLLTHALALKMMDGLREAFNCDRISIYVHDATEGVFTFHSPLLPAASAVPATAGIPGYVFRSCKPLAIPDCYADHRFDPTGDRNSGYTTKSMLSVPILSGLGKGLGVIQAINRLPKSVPVDGNPESQNYLKAIKFKTFDREALEIFANALGKALDEETLTNTLVEEELAKADELLESRSNTASLLPESFGLFLNDVCQIARCDRASLYIFDAQSNIFTVHASNLKTPFRAQLTKGLAASCFSDQEVLNVENCYEDTRFNSALDKNNGYRTTSMLCVALIDLDKESIGVLQLINKLAANIDMTSPNRYYGAVPFTRKDERPVQHLADAISKATHKGTIDDDMLEEFLNKMSESRGGAVADSRRAVMEERHNEANDDGFVGLPYVKDSDKNCRICLERLVEFEFLPCRHRLTCKLCCPVVGSWCLLCAVRIDALEPIRGMTVSRTSGWDVPGQPA